MPARFIRDQWFVMGILVITTFTLWNPNQLALTWHAFLKEYHGTETGIILIFLLSGMELRWRSLQDAIRDWPATLLALISIYILAPLLAWPLSHLSSSPEIQMGLMLVSLVPTSLATGVVLSGIAGGRTAHSLWVTILANILSIVMIPLHLAWMIQTTTTIPMHKISINLSCFVVLPLLVGMLVGKNYGSMLEKLPFRLNLISRLIVLALVFIGLTEGRASLLERSSEAVPAMILALTLHLLLMGILYLILRRLKWPYERSIGVFFMGIQKTLPLCIWLQATLFPTMGMALTVCVLYHVIQLIIDSWLASHLQRKKAN